MVRGSKTVLRFRMRHQKRLVHMVVLTAVVIGAVMCITAGVIAVLLAMTVQ